MPELPEVETVRRGLAATLPKHRIEKVTLNRADLRVPFPKNMAKRLEGRLFTEIERRSKYLLMHTDGPEVLLAHLGMSGSFVVRKKGSAAARKHDHVVISLDNGTELVYHDPRRFGLMELLPKDGLQDAPLLMNLGPEPLLKAFSPDYLRKALLRRKGPVKPALMDAKLVVGVGNIYACEALFRIGMHPTTLAPKAAEQAEKLVEAIRTVLKEAIESGGSTLRDYTGATGKGGYFQHFFYVYGRNGKPCRVCETPIEKTVMAGRGTFFCPHCQALPKVKKAVPQKRLGKAKTKS